VDGPSNKYCRYINKMAEGVGFINVVRFMNLGSTSSEKQRCSTVLFNARNSYFDRLETNHNFASASTKKKIKSISRRVELLELDSCSDTRSISYNRSGSSGSISTKTKIGDGTAANNYDNSQMPLTIEKRVRFDNRLVNIDIPHNQNILDRGTSTPKIEPTLKPTGYKRPKRSSARRETKKSFYDRMAYTETIASASLKIGCKKTRKRSSSVPSSRSRSSRPTSKKQRSRSTSRPRSASTLCTSLEPHARPKSV